MVADDELESFAQITRKTIERDGIARFPQESRPMRSLRALFVFILGFALMACAKPIPKEKVAYVGKWRGTAMALLITQDGSVAYRRLKGGVNTTINAPLKEFRGDNFVVGVGPMATTFVVSVPPHADGDTWKMTVDGVELTRKH